MFATGINRTLSLPHRRLKSNLKNVATSPEVMIIGAGPAGYFAALELIELGLRPVIFERGKDVRSRRKDLRAIQQFGTVDPHSNYCFGEGGAGTYSDGKLYTRAHKRGQVEKVLLWLVHRFLQVRPIKLTITQEHDFCPVRNQCAHQLYQFDVQRFGRMTLGALPYHPGQRQGTTFIDHVDHERTTSPAHPAAIHDQY